MPFPGLFVFHDSVGSGDNEESELSGRENRLAPVFVVLHFDIVSRRNDSDFVNSAHQFDDDFVGAVIVHDFELADVSVFLHYFQEGDQNLGRRPQQHLFVALAFGVYYFFEGIAQNVDFDHIC